MPDGDGPPSPSLWSSLLSQVDKYCSDPIFVPPSRIAAPCPRTAPSIGSIRGRGQASEGTVRRSDCGPFGQRREHQTLARVEIGTSRTLLSVSYLRVRPSEVAKSPVFNGSEGFCPISVDCQKSATRPVGLDHSSWNSPEHVVVEAGEGVVVTAGSRKRARRPSGLQLLSLATALVAAVFAVLVPIQADASALGPLSVSLTFDDGIADQIVGQQLLQQHGMVATFYINSSFIGLPGYMTRAQLDDLKANGHEIGGHTVSHQLLPSLSADEQNRQICQDRDTLMSWGYDVTSFAYPFAEFNATTKAIVPQCGYNSARAVGDLFSPHNRCSNCPATVAVPLADPYAIKTPDDVESTWTLTDLQNLVLHAEETGGWLPLNLHHVCSTGCPVQSISPTVLDEFLTWLQPRSDPSIATTVRTVQQVL